MTIWFAVIVAAMAALALALVVWPLVRGAGTTRRPRTLIAAITVALPLLAIGIYVVVGTPAALNPANRVAHAATMADIKTAVSGLEKHLAEKPDDLEGWTLLGRAYAAMQRPQDAARAYDRALALAPDNADLMAATAEAHTLANADHRIDDDSLALLNKALATNPAQQRALWLVGIADYQRGKYADAIANWNKLLPLLEPGSDVEHSVRQQIASAQAKLNGSGATTAATPAAAASTPVAITVHVALAATVKAKAPADATVFVYARALNGPAMPLAVARLKVADLPADVRLSDRMAMLPRLKLSAFPKVQVTARVSRSGNAMAKPGDLEAAATTVDTRTGKPRVELTIDRVVPPAPGAKPKA